MADDDELRALRARVYGPDAGDQPDADLIRRLQELEAARRPPPRVLTAEPVATEAAPVEPEQAPEPVVDVREPTARVILRWATGLRRSTLLILLAVAVFVAVVAVVLTLVQRVQSDPLRTGAQQVARLGVDTTFRTPDFFGEGPYGESTIQGFQPFAGMRPVVAKGGFFGLDPDAPCLTVFSNAIVEDPDSDPFPGALIGGCAVGGFPAMGQFLSDLEGFPEELEEESPDSALQLVYDSVNNEVVVFVLRS